MTHIRVNNMVLLAHPVKNMQSGTHTPPLLYFLQDTHWSGPGPQQPSDEQRGSHTWPSLSTDINIKKKPIALFSTMKGLLNDRPSLTTLEFSSILLDINMFLAALRAGAAAEESCPVHSVVVAEHRVSCYIHAAIIYFPKRA